MATRAEHQKRLAQLNRDRGKQLDQIVTPEWLVTIPVDGLKRIVRIAGDTEAIARAALESMALNHWGLVVEKSVKLRPASLERYFRNRP
jgi:hypothetical protein